MSVEFQKLQVVVPLTGSLRNYCRIIMSVEFQKLQIVVVPLTGSLIFIYLY